jgi:hypothetical protein
MGKDNFKAPEFKIPIPYIPEEKKEVDTSDGKPPSVKLLPVNNVFDLFDSL